MPFAGSLPRLAAEASDSRHYGFFNRDIRALEFLATLDSSATSKFLIETLCPFPICRLLRSTIFFASHFSTEQTSSHESCLTSTKRIRRIGVCL